MKKYLCVASNCVWFIVWFLFANLLAMHGTTQPVDLDQIFIWSVESSKQEVPQGASGFIQFTVNIVPDHFVYREATSFEIKAPESIQILDPIFPEAKIKTDPTDGQEKPIYENTQVFKVPFSVLRTAPTGAVEITAVARYRGCSQTVCFFPQTREFPLTITIIEGATALESTVARTTSLSSNQSTAMTQSDYFARGTFLTFFLIFLAGVGTSLTPCVYPLIPITITIFGARETKNKVQAFSLAYTYVLGIVLMYSVLGLVVAQTGAVFGQFMSNPWVMGVIAAIFIALGASMLGAFDFQVPQSIQSRLSRVGGKGYGSAFTMGLVAGIIAAPCTGPALAGILTYVATEGDPFLGFWLLLVYAHGLGMLFLLVGTFSGMLSHIPKAGKWMENVKSMFGIVLFACALYFLKNAFPALQINFDSAATVYALAGLLLVIGVVLGAIHLSFHTHNWMAFGRKGLGVLLCVVALYLPFGSKISAGTPSSLDWIYNDIEKGLEQAKQQEKPAMIDFWAEWCAACKEIDHYTFRNPTVEQRLKQFVTIKVDLTKSTPENQKIQETYSITGLPLIVFYDSKGNRLPDKNITGFINAETFLNHIKDIQ